MERGTGEWIDEKNAEQRKADIWFFASLRRDDSFFYFVTHPFAQKKPMRKKYENYLSSDECGVHACRFSGKAMYLPDSHIQLRA